MVAIAHDLSIVPMYAPNVHKISESNEFAAEPVFVRKLKLTRT